MPKIHLYFELYYGIIVTVRENIIGAPKMRNNFGVIKLCAINKNIKLRQQYRKFHLVKISLPSLLYFMFVL